MKIVFHLSGIRHHFPFSPVIMIRVPARSRFPDPEEISGDYKKPLPPGIITRDSAPDPKTTGLFLIAALPTVRSVISDAAQFFPSGITAPAFSHIGRVIIIHRVLFIIHDGPGSIFPSSRRNTGTSRAGEIFARKPFKSRYHPLA
jgi:hypothetical protein